MLSLGASGARYGTPTEVLPDRAIIPIKIPKAIPRNPAKADRKIKIICKREIALDIDKDGTENAPKPAIDTTIISIGLTKFALTAA